jgi:ABC-type nickel/cobalt efflux system permease component RcnA
VLLLVFALAQGVFAAGLVGVLAMSLGTGLTVGALALLAVGAKGLAVRLAARRSALGAAVAHGIELAGALAVTAFGALFLLAALSAR